MFAKLARFVVTHAWMVIGAWVAFTVVVLLLSPDLSRFTSNNNSAFLPASYESVKAQNLIQADFPAAAQASGILVVYRSDGGALDAADNSTISGLVADLEAKRIPSLESVQTDAQLRSANGQVQLVELTFNGQPGANGPNDAVAAVRQDTTAYLAGSDLSAGLTGSAPISVDSTHAYSQAEKVIAIATVLLILLLLGLVFRSVVIAVLPIVVIGVVHQVAQSITADLADWFHFQVGSVLAPLLVVVMFGIGTDYIVFLLFRHREQLQLGEDVLPALERSTAAVAVVIASAAATVAAAFAALLVASLESLRTLAPGLIVGVVCMLFAALTLVPAIISLLGRHLFWPSSLARVSAVPEKASASERLGARVARRPASIFALFVVVLAAIGSAAFGYKATYNQLAELPGSTLSLQAFNVMAKAFPEGTLGPTQVIVTSSSPLSETELGTLAGALKSATGVAAVLTPQVSTNGKAALLNVLLSSNPYSTTAMNDVAGPIRSAAHHALGSSATVLVGGTTSQLADVRTALGHDTKLVFPLAFVIIAVILALLLRALVAPLWLLVGVSLTFGATVGATVLVFLKGISWSGLDFSIPIVVYLFVVAIGTDYNILMSHRLKEEFDNGFEAREAARRAITHGAPAVTAAGLVLAGTFLSLLLTGIQNLQEIGFGVAFGVVVAANVLSTRLVPTIASLRGWRFWWPHGRHRLTVSGAPAGDGLGGGTGGDGAGTQGAPELEPAVLTVEVSSPG